MQIIKHVITFDEIENARFNVDAVAEIDAPDDCEPHEIISMACEQNVKFNRRCRAYGFDFDAINCRVTFTRNSLEFVEFLAEYARAIFDDDRNEYDVERDELFNNDIEYDALHYLCRVVEMLRAIINDRWDN